jgi:hypothetical protein
MREAMRVDRDALKLVDLALAQSALDGGARRFGNRISRGARLCFC